MSEAVLQADLQRELLTLSSHFSSGDVTINDSSVLENTDLAPYAIVESADEFELETVDTQWSNIWQLPFMLAVYFTDSDAAANSLTTLRDAVLAHLLDKESYSASSAKLAYGLRGVRPAGPTDYIYDSARVQAAESEGLEPPLPMYLAQRLICTVQEVQVG
jgi:hypothetical protein